MTLNLLYIEMGFFLEKNMGVSFDLLQKNMRVLWHHIIIILHCGGPVNGQTR